MRVCIALIDATASVFIANYHLNRIGVVNELSFFALSSRRLLATGANHRESQPKGQMRDPVYMIGYYHTYTV